MFLAAFRYRHRLLGHFEAASKAIDLGTTEAVALLHLSFGPSPVSAIAQAAAIRQNGSSILVKRLAARGLVRRSRRSNDRRVVDVLLTDAGRSLVDSLVPDLDREMGAFFSRLSEEERQQFFSLLLQLLPAPS